MAYFFRARRAQFLLAFSIAALALIGAMVERISAAGHESARLKPQATGVYSGSVAGSYVLGVANTDASDPFNDYAVEGEVPYDVGGVGVLGYANAAKSYAVYGVTFGSNGIGVYGAGDGPTPAPAATPSGTQQSTGVAGNSASGQGVFGSTEFPNYSDSLVNPAAGVMGVDAASAPRDNVGVAGETTNGDFGTIGLGGAGAVGGVAGAGDTGVAGFSSDNGNNFPGAAAGAFFGTYNSIYGQAGTAIGGATSYPLYLADSNQSPLLYVDNSGDTYVEGTLYVHGGQSTFERTPDPRMNVEAYNPTTTRPTTEDFGQAELVDGAAYVRLDPTFAASIDAGTAYMVFVTPLGDTNGLYVTQQSARGFAVRENRGGRSSVGFNYRIVAQQYGTTGRRAAVVDATVDQPPRLTDSRTILDAKFARLMREFRSHARLLTVRPVANRAVERRP